jgi:hypothetical protein
MRKKIPKQDWRKVNLAMMFTKKKAIVTLINASAKQTDGLVFL